MTLPRWLLITALVGGSLAAALVPLVKFRYNAAASPPPLTSSQLLQRSVQAMNLVQSGHDQSSVHVVSRSSNGKTPRSTTQRVIADCTSTKSATQFTSAERATIVGTITTGKARPQPVHTHFVFLSSGSINGNNQRIAFWERDATKSNRWHNVATPAGAPGFIGFLWGHSCPRTDSGFAFQMAQSGWLAPLVESTSLGRPVWAIAGTSGSSAEHFSFTLFIDRMSYYLDGFTTTIVERIGGRVVSRLRVATTYSLFNEPLSIKAPVAGSTTP